MCIVYIAVELSFIVLISLKLYFSYGVMQVYFVGFVLVKSSELSMSEVVVSTLNVIVCCNCVAIYFLVMDEQFSKAERYTVKSIIAMTVLLAWRLN